MDKSRLGKLKEGISDGVRSASSASSDIASLTSEIDARLASRSSSFVSTQGSYHTANVDSPSSISPHEELHFIGSYDMPSLRSHLSGRESRNSVSAEEIADVVRSVSFTLNPRADTHTPRETPRICNDLDSRFSFSVGKHETVRSPFMSAMAQQEIPGVSFRSHEPNNLRQSVDSALTDRTHTERLASAIAPGGQQRRASSPTACLRDDAPTAEYLDEGELRKLSSQLEAAVNTQLTFKDRFRSLNRSGATTVSDLVAAELAVPAQQQTISSPTQRMTMSILENAIHAETGAYQLQTTTSRSLSTGAPMVDAIVEVAPKVVPQPPAPAVTAAAAAAPAGKPAFKKPGLQLQVGSKLDQGEWDSKGMWMCKNPSQEYVIPSYLQHIPAEDLVKVRELGRGCFGSVWLGRWRGVDVALKEMLNTRNDDCPPAEIFQEAERLACLRHPCVLCFYGIVCSPGSYATVTEYMRMGSLKSGLHTLKAQGPVSPGIKAAIAMQGARGMEYLHSQFMVHFDLKCDNMLCDLRDPPNPVVKIGDLGLSKQKKGTFISGNMRGTLPWMAPELFPGNQQSNGNNTEDRVNEKVDVFSFGVVLWEIWTLGDSPYQGVGLADIFAGVMTGTLRPKLPADCDPAWVALMQDCWHSVPKARPSFGEIGDRLEKMVQAWLPKQ